MNYSSPEPCGRAKDRASRAANPPYRPCIVSHGFAYRTFTPPYSKGGA
jgi:hypothetical protein